METDTLKGLTYKELQNRYSEYLLQQNLSPKTINTYKHDAFYLLNHAGTIDFWELLTRDDFEEVARQSLLSALEQNSSGRITVNVNSYLVALRRFRNFALCKTNTDTESDSNNMQQRQNGQLRIPPPCEGQLQSYLHSWEKSESYRTQEAALNKLFQELAPYNTQMEDILLKAATLNTFYSTNIYAIYPVAKHILSLQIDQRLRSGDITLVSDIMCVSAERHYYSFATKYCSHHNSNAYPIYDSYIDKVLRHFRDQDNFCSFQSSDLKHYGCFKQILLRFQAYYGLENYSLKAIDKYLWQLGKQYYPKTY